MTEYKVVSSDDLELLEHEVNLMISNGWTPIGGIAVAYVGPLKMRHDGKSHDESDSPFYARFAQAMIRNRN